MLRLKKIIYIYIWFVINLNIISVFITLFGVQLNSQWAR